MDNKVKSRVYALPIGGSEHEQLRFPEVLIPTITSLPAFEACILVLNNTEGLAVDEREQLRNHVLGNHRLSPEIAHLISSLKTSKDVGPVIGAIRDSIHIDRQSSYSFQNNLSQRSDSRARTPFCLASSDDNRSECSGQAFGEPSFPRHESNQELVPQPPGGSKIILGLPDCSSSEDDSRAHLPQQNVSDSRIETDPDYKLQLLGDTFSRDATPQNSVLIAGKRHSQKSSMSSQGNYSLGMVDPEDVKRLLHKPFHDKRHNVSVLEPQILYTAPQQTPKSPTQGVQFYTQPEDTEHEKLADSLDTKMHKRKHSKHHSGIFAKLENELSKVKQEQIMPLRDSEDEENEIITPDDLKTNFVQRLPNQITSFEFQTFRKVEFEQTLGPTPTQSGVVSESPPKLQELGTSELLTPDNRQKPQLRPTLQSTPMLVVKADLPKPKVAPPKSRTPELFNYWTPTGGITDKNKLSKTPSERRPAHRINMESTSRLNTKNRNASEAQQNFLKMIKASREFTTSFLQSRGPSRAGTPTLTRQPGRGSEAPLGEVDNRRILTEEPTIDKDNREDSEKGDLRDLMTSRSRGLLVKNLNDFETRRSSNSPSKKGTPQKRSSPLRGESPKIVKRESPESTSRQGSASRTSEEPKTARRNESSQERLDTRRILASTRSKRQRYIGGLAGYQRGSMDNLSNPSPSAQIRNPAFKGQALQNSFFTQNSMSVINGGPNESYLSEEVREITSKLEPKQHFRLFSTTLQDFNGVESPTRPVSTGPGSRKRPTPEKRNLADQIEEAVIVRKLESSESEFTLQQDTDRIKVIPEATDQGSSCKPDHPDQSKIIVKAHEAIKIIPEAQSWEEDRSHSTVVPRQVGIAEIGRYSLPLLSIATFLRYFSPHDILLTFYKEISSSSSSILSKSGFRTVFKKSILSLGVMNKMNETRNIVEKEGFKNAVDWLFDVYTIGPDTKRVSEGKLVFQQIVPALCILGGGNTVERVAAGFNDANAKRGKNSKSLEALLGESSAFSSSSKTSSLVKTRVDFQTLLNYLTNLFKLLVAASSELVQKLRRGYFESDQRVTYASLAEACALHCYEDLDKDKENGDKISDKAFAEWFQAVNSAPSPLGVTTKLAKLRPPSQFPELSELDDSLIKAKPQEERKMPSKDALRLNLDSLRGTPASSKNNNERSHGRLRSKDLQSTLQRELEERLAEMRRSTQVGEDADGVATFRSSSVDKHMYALRPVSDLESSERPRQPSQRLNYSSQPPSLQPEFIHHHQRSRDFTNSIPSQRSNSESSIPLTERQLQSGKYYFQGSDASTPHHAPPHPYYQMPPPQQHMLYPQMMPPHPMQMPPPLPMHNIHPMSLHHPMAHHHQYISQLPMHPVFNSGAVTQRAPSDSMMSGGNNYYYPPGHYHHPSQYPMSRRISLHSYMPSEPVTSREGTQELTFTGTGTAPTTAQFPLTNEDLQSGIDTRRSTRYPVNQSTWDYYEGQHVGLRSKRLQEDEPERRNAPVILTRPNEPRINNWGGSKAMQTPPAMLRESPSRKDNNRANTPNNNSSSQRALTPTGYKSDLNGQSARIAKFDQVVKQIGLHRSNIKERLQSRTSRARPTLDLDRELNSEYESRKRDDHHHPPHKRIQSKSPTTLTARDLDDSVSTHYHFNMKRLNTSRASSQVSTPCTKTTPMTPHSHMFLSKLCSLAPTPRMQTPTHGELR